MQSSLLAVLLLTSLPAARGPLPAAPASKQTSASKPAAYFVNYISGNKFAYLWHLLNCYRLLKAPPKIFTQSSHHPPWLMVGGGSGSGTGGWGSGWGSGCPLPPSNILRKIPNLSRTFFSSNIGNGIHGKTFPYILSSRSGINTLHYHLIPLSVVTFLWGNK